MKDVASKVNNIQNEYLNGNKKKAYLELISKNISNEKLKFNLAYGARSGYYRRGKEKLYFLNK